MKHPRWLLALTLVNLGLLVVQLVVSIVPAAANGAPSVLRGHALEIVDERGRVRASIGVLPPTRQSNGETSAETVLLRLITERGRPSVKIGASEQEAAMSLAGPTGTQRTYIVVEAKGTASRLQLKSEDGSEQLIKP